MKSIAMLKLKIVEPPVEQLTELAEMIRKTRNIGLEDWLLRQRGKPESAVQSALSTRRKNVATEKPEPKQKHPSTKIYNAMAAAKTGVIPDVIARLSADVWSNLNAKLDWRRRAGDEAAKPRKRADAIVDYEDRPPWFTSLDIPVLNKHAHVEFGDDLTLTVRRLAYREDLAELHVKFSLKGFPRRLKALIRRVLAGELKLSDSSIRQKPSGDWYWYWPIQMESSVTVDDTRSAVLAPQFMAEEGKQTDRPFAMVFPENNRWYIGEGRYLHSQTMRLTGLRKMVGYRYRNGLAKGHGRKKMDSAVSKRNTQLRNIRDEFRRKTVSDAVKQCERHQCGLLIYREPTGPAKSKCWFESNGLEFDWTAFLTDLKNSCARRGIKVKVEKLKIGEVIKKGDAA